MLTVKNSLLPTVSNFFDDDWQNLLDWNKGKQIRHYQTTPFVNIKESDEGFLLQLAAPGLSKKDFKIEIQNSLLTVKCELSESNQTDEGGYTLREFNFSSFQRTFQINEKIIDEAGIKAVYRNGLLMVSIPKREEAKPKPVREISIS